jgi:hypothetical protein
LIADDTSNTPARAFSPAKKARLALVQSGCASMRVTPCAIIPRFA